MYFVFTYFFFFVLTYLGFVLGKSTKEEHEEINIYIQITSVLFKLIFYGVMFYILWGTIFVYLQGLLFILFGISKRMKSQDLLKLTNVILFGVSFLYLFNYSFEIIYLMLLLIFSLMLENSLSNFYLKEEMYVVGIYLLVYFVFFLFN